jgi:hypothetical protein
MKNPVMIMAPQSDLNWLVPGHKLNALTLRLYTLFRYHFTSLIIYVFFA